METFDFPYHLRSTEYPESSVRVQFGRAYTFTAAPSAPDQRIFVLDFKGMKRYVDEDGELDINTNPQMNFNVLEAFYQEHRLHKSFIYPHADYGNLVVKFHEPLKVPKGIEGGSGVLEPFTLKFAEQP